MTYTLATNFMSHYLSSLLKWKQQWSLVILWLCRWHIYCPLCLACEFKWKKLSTNPNHNMDILCCPMLSNNDNSLSLFFHHVTGELEIQLVQRLIEQMSIHPLSTTYPVRGCRGARLHLSIFGQRLGTPCTSHQFIAELIYRHKQSTTLTFTPTGNLELSINLTPSLNVFRLWEEARVPGENPCRHRENMQTPNSVWTDVTWAKSTIILGKNNMPQWIYALLKVTLQWIHNLGDWWEECLEVLEYFTFGKMWCSRMARCCL